MALGTVILAVSIVIAALAEILRHRGLVAASGRRLPIHQTTRNRKRRTAMAFDLKSTSERLRREPALRRSPCCSPSADAAALAEDKLQYFTWSGYELPDFNKSFLAAHPDGVEASMFGDDDDAFTKVKAGFRPDVAHPCYDKVARWNKEGLLQPIDTKRIKNWDSIFPVFKNLPDLQAGDGKVWMVPWDWGNTSILYRTDLVKNPEASWNLLWDKQYAGRMATIDAVHDTPVVAALLAGVNPFDMTPAEMDKVAEKLREQRPLLSHLHDRHDLGRTVAGERRAGRRHDLERVGDRAEEAGRAGRVHEAEGRHADLGLRLRACSRTPRTSTSPMTSSTAGWKTDSGKYLIEAYGYGSSTSTAFAAVPKEELEKLQLPADPEVMLKTTVFTGPMKQNDELAKMFEKVKAGG